VSTLPASTFRVSRNIRLFNVMVFVREFMPLVAVWVVYLTDYRHLTLAQVGLMEGLFWLVKLGAEIPSGAFADRYGRRASMLMGVVLEASGLVLFGYASDFAILTASYVIWGIGFAFRSGAEEAYLYDALAADERSHEYTDRMGVLWAINLGGSLCGSIAGGVIAVMVSLPAAIFATVGSYVLVLPLLLMMQEPPRATTTRRGYTEVLREGFAIVRREHALRNMVFLQVVLMSAWAGFSILSQPFLQQHGVPLSLYGVASGAVMLLSGATGLVSGRVVRWIGISKALVVAMVGAVAGLAMLALVDHVVAYAGFAITSAAIGLVQPASIAYVNDRVDSSARATVMSLSPFGQSIAIALTNTAAGVLGDASPQLAYAILAGFIGISGTISFAAWRSADRAMPMPATKA